MEGVREKSVAAEEPSAPKGALEKVGDVLLSENKKSKVFSTLATHPVRYVQTLIQIGYEPIPGRPTRTWLWNKPALSLPSVFEYMSYIRRRDGYWGLYRGLVPSLIETRVVIAVSDKIQKRLSLDPLAHIPDADLSMEEFEKREAREARNLLLETPDEELSSPQITQKYKDLVLKVSVEKALEVILTHPLHVITVRSMAQFVGGEDKYGFLNSFFTIFEENGLLGFWAGLIPRLIGEVLSVGLSTCIVYLVNTHVLKDKELKSYTPVVANLAVSSFCHPFNVVSNCMAVSRSGLIAGYPPYMPLYLSWVDCWSALSRSNQLKRGSSLIFRKYILPSGSSYEYKGSFREAKNL